MIRIALCDDDTSCLKNLKEMLEIWSEASSTPLTTTGFSNADALMEELQKTEYDLLFLDIVMPLVSGMDAAVEIRQQNKSVPLIFLTSSPEFALQSYSVKAFDYCLKPLTYEKLSAVMKEYCAAHQKEPESILLKVSTGYQKIYLQEVEFLEAQNKRVIFTMRNGSAIEVVQPLHTFEMELPQSKGFFKCHRSYLVYLPNVHHFSTTEIITKSGHQIPIARGCGKLFQDAYFSFMFQD